MHVLMLTCMLMHMLTHMLMLTPKRMLTYVHPLPVARFAEPRAQYLTLPHHVAAAVEAQAYRLTAQLLQPHAYAYASRERWQASEAVAGTCYSHASREWLQASEAVVGIRGSSRHHATAIQAGSGGRHQRQ